MITPVLCELALNSVFFSNSLLVVVVESLDISDPAEKLQEEMGRVLSALQCLGLGFPMDEPMCTMGHLWQYWKVAWTSSCHLQHCSGHWESEGPSCPQFCLSEGTQWELSCSLVNQKMDECRFAVNV